MSKYNVRLNAGNNKIIQAIKKSPVNVDVSTSQEIDTIGELDDVDLTDRQDGYLLMWNQARATHEYVPPFEVVDRSDSDNPVLPGDNAIDYGTF